MGESKYMIRKMIFSSCVLAIMSSLNLFALEVKANGYDANLEEEEYHDPVGIYYTTPWCQQKDIYYGTSYADALMFYIMDSSDDDLSMDVAAYSLTDMSEPIIDQMTFYYDESSKIWMDEEFQNYFYYDEEYNRFIFQKNTGNSRLSICLEAFSAQSAWQPVNNFYETVPVGDYESEDGYTLSVYDLFNAYNGEFALVTVENSEEDMAFYLAEKEAVQEKRGYTKFYIMEDKDTLSTVSIQINTIDKYGVESIKVLNEETGEAAIYTKKNGIFTEMYNTPEKYEGTYKIQDASDDSYITLIYNTDYRSYHYKVVVQGETIIEGWDAFVGFGMILSSEMQMNLNEYLDGTEDTISVFIPRYALTISVLPEQEIR